MGATGGSATLASYRKGIIKVTDYSVFYPALNLRCLPILTTRRLRLSYGTVRRLPRVFPNDDIQYKEHVIPRGVGVPLLELEPKLSL